MLTSELEVSKFNNAKLKTVSGIRGKIKKVIGKNGDFRATFENKLLLSDIVILRTYITVKP